MATKGLSRRSKRKVEGFAEDEGAGRGCSSSRCGQDDDRAAKGHRHPLLPNRFWMWTSVAGVFPDHPRGGVSDA